jgi:hypothetical protein
VTGVAYQYVYNWLAGTTMPNPCNLNGGTTLEATYTCDIYKGSGYHGQVVWNTVQTCNLTNDTCTTISFNPGQEFKQYRDLKGNVTQINGPVYIGESPILLENQ